MIKYKNDSENHSDDDDRPLDGESRLISHNGVTREGTVANHASHDFEPPLESSVVQFLSDKTLSDLIRNPPPGSLLKRLLVAKTHRDTEHVVKKFSKELLMTSLLSSSPSSAGISVANVLLGRFLLPHQYFIELSTAMTDSGSSLPILWVLSRLTLPDDFNFLHLTNDDPLKDPVTKMVKRVMVFHPVLISKIPVEWLSSLSGLNQQ